MEWWQILLRAVQFIIAEILEALEEGRLEQGKEILRSLRKSIETINKAV